MSVQRFSLLFLLLILAPAVASAQSPLAWRMDAYRSVGDFDDVPGDESEFIYLVYNTSPSGDANNLMSLIFLAGADRGVYEASGPTGWLADIQTDRTVFSGNGNYISPPGGAGFYLYSRYTGTATGAAEAASAANGGFPTLTVTLPAPRPASLNAASISVSVSGTNLVALAVTSPDAPSFLLQYTATLAPTNWTDLARIAATGAVTVATDTNAVPTRFYRAVVP